MKNIAGIKTISISGVSGNELLRSNNLQDEYFEINCSALKSGIYFLSILTSENKFVAGKFILVR